MSEDILLRRPFHGGADIVVRELHPGDRAMIVEGFSHLSERSRFMRFLGARKTLSAAELDRLTDPSDRDDVAFGAMLTTGADENSGTPVGVARFVRLEPGGPVAEIAVTVVDDLQHLGAGSILLQALAEAARRSGVSEFRALVHPENHEVRSFMKKVGAEPDDPAQPEIAFRVPVDRIPPPAPPM